MKHLDEISAQIFLEDGGIDLSVRDHLEECGECRKLVRDYELLFKNLSNADGKDSLSDGFTQKCISEIDNRKFSLKIIRTSFYISAGLICLVISVLYRGFLTGQLRFMGPVLDFFTGFPKKLSPFGGLSSVHINIFFIFLAVMLADFFFFRKFYRKLR
ncbi:hypothetical protein JW890_00610 [candidate division WOR-3 bacterium]|nr:hypothetical protein [candidate division WOR-3 bacterium]